MAVNHVIKRAAISTSSSGTVDLTDTSFGTVKAAVVMLTSCVTDDTQAADGRMSIGFWDGTNQVGVGFNETDGNVSTNHGASVGTLTTAIKVASGAGDQDGTGTVSNITDGIRITSSVSAPSTAMLTTAWMMNGADLTNAWAGEVDLNGTTPIDETGPNFNPDLLIVASRALAGESNNANAGLTIGFVHNNGSELTKSVGMHSQSVNPTQIRHYSDSGNFSPVTFNGVDWTATFSDFDASGFTVVADSATTDTIYMLALKFTAGWGIKILDFDSRTGSTGSEATTGVGFTPESLMILTSNSSTRDVLQTADVDALGITLSDGTNTFGHSASSDDAVTTVVAKSISTSGSLICLDGGSGTDAKASFTSLDSDGFTFNYSTAPGSARKYTALAIGENAAAGARPQGPLGHPFNGPFGGPL